MHPEEKLKELGLTLPSVGTPVANFVHFRLVGDMLYISGQGPTREDGTQYRGKLGAGVGVEEGYAAARQAGVNILAVAKKALGDLDRVAGVVKLLGMVNAAPDFDAHPAVINGCSDLLVAVLGERGQHARSAVGFASLPGGISVEIEAILQVRI